MTETVDRLGSAGTTVGKRSLWAIAITCVLYALLVGTHRGEFWPLSIYPMFSKAKSTLYQVAVQRVSPGVWSEPEFWRGYGPGEIPGKPFAVAPHGMDAVDLAKYVRLTTDWTADRKQGIVDFFGDTSRENTLVIMSAKGSVDRSGKLEVTYRPILVLEDGKAWDHRWVEAQHTEKGR